MEEPKQSQDIVKKKNKIFTYAIHTLMTCILVS